MIRMHVRCMQAEKNADGGFRNAETPRAQQIADAHQIQVLQVVCCTVVPAVQW